MCQVYKYLDKLTPQQQANMIHAVAGTHYLSEEGRKERLAYLHEKVHGVSEPKFVVKARGRVAI